MSVSDSTTVARSLPATVKGVGMRVLLTGANGWVGSVVARELIDAGHSVVGLVRSKEKGEVLAAAGGTPLLGSRAD